jgi:hypothetical protein
MSHDDAAWNRVSPPLSLAVLPPCGVTKYGRSQTVTSRQWARNGTEVKPEASQ